MLTPQFLLPIADEQKPRVEGRFVRGHSYSPATQIKPGQRLNRDTEFRPGERRSPNTEFKPGQAAHNRLPVGSVTVRTFKGVQRAFVKIAEPNVWRERAKVVWEEAHRRPVPRGLVIHHCDRDSLNDAPGNLVALTRKEHVLEHAEELRRARSC